MYSAFKEKVPCEANPWGAGADTLEWTVPSPAPFHTHEVIPDISGTDSAK